MRHIYQPIKSKMETFVIVCFFATTLLSLLLASIFKNQRDEALEVNEESQYEEEAHTVGQHLDRLENESKDIKREIQNLGNCILVLQSKTNHLATVQTLILKDMDKEHQIQPAKDVLVTIGNLSDLKKPKERSA